MGFWNKIFDRFFKKNDQKQLNEPTEVIEDIPVEANKVEKTEFEKENEEVRKNIMRNQQIKFAFRNLSLANMYIDNETIERKVMQQDFNSFELSQLDMEVLKAFNKSNMNNNISKEELEYMQDTDNITKVIDFVEENAKNQVREHQYTETEAYKFIKTDEAINTYMNIEKQENNKEIENDMEYDEK